jgi:hypothetical protein
MTPTIVRSPLESTPFAVQMPLISNCHSFSPSSLAPCRVNAPQDSRKVPVRRRRRRKKCHKTIAGNKNRKLRLLIGFARGFSEKQSRSTPGDDSLRSANGRAKRWSDEGGRSIKIDKNCFYKKLERFTDLK